MTTWRLYRDEWQRYGLIFKGLKASESDDEQAKTRASNPDDDAVLYKLAEL